MTLTLLFNIQGHQSGEPGNDAKPKATRLKCDPTIGGSASAENCELPII
jgi:hypothetical protein